MKLPTGRSRRFSHCQPTRVRLAGSHNIELYAAFASGQKHSPRRMLPAARRRAWLRPDLVEVEPGFAEIPHRFGASAAGPDVAVRRDVRRRQAGVAGQDLTLFDDRPMGELVVFAAKGLHEAAKARTPASASMSATRSSTTAAYASAAGVMSQADRVELETLFRDLGDERVGREFPAHVLAQSRDLVSTLNCDTTAWMPTVTFGCAAAFSSR